MFIIYVGIQMTDLKKKLNRVSSLILNSVDKFMSVFYTG